MLDTIIDISHHNHKPRFDLAKQSGIYGIIHKSTQGSSYTDPTFTTRRDFIEDVGLKLGAYHFLTNTSPIQQADHFLTVTRDVPLLVVDWESNNGKLPSVAVLSEFIRHVNGQGRSLGLYLGNADLKAHVKQFDLAIRNCWLWVARYGKLPEVPLNSWPTFTLWQWTDGLHNQPVPVPGIGYADRNKFNGDQTALDNLWSQS